jgi:Transposase family tnp2
MKCILKGRSSTASLASEVPKDPRRLLTLYHLDPVLHSYICCPACYCLYPYSIVQVKTKKRKSSTLSGEPPGLTGNADDDTSGDAPIVPTTPTNCTQRRVPSGAVCGEPLFNPVTINGDSHTVPRLKYHAQDLKQWVGWLLSRPAIEEEVFKAFRRPRKERMEDIWDGRHLCRVLLRKGERFLPGPVNETRLAFSFSMDSFNPYHMKESKQTVSSTAIWLILLNLPSHLRYRPENMFLAGIIPGPKKPSLSDINHSINPLVDVLCEFFQPGILYSRTSRHTQGCQVRAIMVPVVADMLAARQAGGFASPTATFFCTLCNLNIQDIENLDKLTWRGRDVGEHGRIARQWRDAQTTEEQEALFKSYGIRWSPLLSLPYWNPILFTAIEPMHVFDAGLFQTHCRHVWGIDTTAISGNGLVPESCKAVARPSDSDMSKWYDVIRDLKNTEDVREQLKDCPREALWHICNDNDLRRADPRNRHQLVKTIVEWVRQSTALFALHNCVKRSARWSHPKKPIDLQGQSNQLFRLPRLLKLASVRQNL